MRMNGKARQMVIPMKRELSTMPIRAKPFEHQVRAFQFTLGKFEAGAGKGSGSGAGAALLMEMGTGKTMVSIAVMGELYRRGRIRRALVVAPLSILGVWQEETEKFAAYPVDVTVLKGNSQKKREQLKTKPKPDALRIVIVNYESARLIEDELIRYDADLVIADEGHKIKENRTAQSKTMHHLGDKARYKLLLTGTLITNKEMDVFSQYRFADKTVFGTSFYAFRNKYFDMMGYGNHTPVFRRHMTEEFLKRLHSIAFRVTKEECLDLPEIVEETRTVELETNALKLYKQIEKESYAELSESSEVSAVNVLTKLLRLSQVTGGHLTDDSGKTTTVSKAKLDALSDIIDSTLAEGRKLVIMARFVPEMDDIQKRLEDRGIGYAAVRGGVKDRAEEVRRFQEDPDCQVFVGQIAAAGVGLTLTAASTMVFYSLDYSMANFEQAKARIHRVSQKKDCLYIYLIAKGTVDAKILKALRDKTDLARALVDDWRDGRNPFL